MARRARPCPWYYRQAGAWMAYIDGKKTRLAEGRKNKQKAETRLRELLLLRDRNPSADCEEQTVASVIEKYLAHASRMLAARTLYERRLVLQSFAEAHGWREVASCRPYHVNTWIESHARWRSDWTVNTAVKTVLRPFSWAVKQGLIDQNPCTGARRWSKWGWPPVSTGPNPERAEKTARRGGRL